jgi:RNA polymerase sigma-70 factor (ECF subfamily)
MDKREASTASDTLSREFLAETSSPETFAMAVAALRPYLFKRAMYLAKERELAEDLAQSALIKALTAETLFEPGTNLKGWVTTILQNEYYSHRRRSWRSTPLSEFAAENLPSPLGEQETSVDLRNVACAMVTLPETQRRALVAVGFLGYSYAEAAIVFSCSIGTIKSRVSRARMALLDELKRPTPRKRRRMGGTTDEFAALISVVERTREAASGRLSRETPVKGAEEPNANKIGFLAAA